MRQKAQEQQGLKEHYLTSITGARSVLEESFRLLELKGKEVKTYNSSEDYSEIISTLHKIEPLITSENDIPHARAKLKNYPSLNNFFQHHLKEGLYLLQFRKCNNDGCCVKNCEILPPVIPAPVLSPDKQSYLDFDDLYGKVVTTEIDCPSLKKTSGEKKKNQMGMKFLAKKVVSTINCNQCGKPRCVFSATGSIDNTSQRQLEDVMFSCGMTLDSHAVYVKADMSCKSNVENAFYLSKPLSQHVCVHCGCSEFDKKCLKEFSKKFRVVFPCCSHCKDVLGKKEICLNPKSKTEGCITKKVTTIEIAEENRDAENVSFQKEYTIVNEATSSKKRQSNLEEWRAPKDKIVKNESSKDLPQQQSSFFEKDDVCGVCSKEDPPGRARTVTWVDCDKCHLWAHLVCAKSAGWINIHRNSWLCQQHCNDT